MMNDGPLARQVEAMVGAVREPLALDRWGITVEVGAGEQRGGCAAAPEYREATIVFDLEKFETGDDPAEMVAHEMAHPHIWPLHALAEDLAAALAASAPEHLRGPLGTLLSEQVRLAAETVTTDVGQTYLRLLRRAGILESPT